MKDKMFDFLMDHGKWRAAWSVGAICFVLAAAFYTAPMSVSVLAGAASWCDIVIGAVACGVGTALVGSILAAVHA